MAQRFERVGGILSYFTRHATAANLLLVLLVAAGLTAFPQMRAQFFPDVVVDDINVYVLWDGAGPEDVDNAIVQVMEPTLLAVEGVTDSQASSTEGSARIVLEFEPGWDMDRAADEVQLAVDTVDTLPDDAETPIVRRGTWNDRVTDVVITGPVGVDQLGRFADEFVARLFAEGVTRTTIRGVASPETRIEVTSAALIRYDITMAEIAAAIAEEAAADPAGEVAGANARVRTGTDKTKAQEIEQIVLRLNADGSELTIGDVGQVFEGRVDRDRAYFVGDSPAISIRVDRSDRGDAIGIQRQVEAVAAEIELSLPEEVEVTLIRTRAEAISGRLNVLLDNGLTGLALVVGLLFLFLNARTAFWVAAGIPAAMTAAIAMMFLAGITINMISLFALIITLGIVVDDAIVVGEHADARARRFGEGPYEAAENAARRMFPPVFSATLTTIIAFFGLTAISGRFGDLIADIPFTVIVVLLASLIECFLILPAHMAHSLKARARPGFSLMRAVFGFVGVVVLGMVGVIVTGLLALGAMQLVAGLFGAEAPAWLTGLPAAVWSQLATSAIGLAIGVTLVVALRLFLMGGTARAETLAMMSDKGIDMASTIVNRGFTRFRETIFRRFIGWVIWARYPVMAGAVAVLSWQTAPVITGDLQWRFFNAPERGSVSGNFAMVPGSTREDTMVMMREMQRATEAVATRFEEETGVNPLTFVMAEVGGTTGRGLSGVDTKEDYQLGSIAIELIDADLRPYTAREFVGALQDEVRRTALTEIVSFRSWGSGPGGDALDIELFGAEPEVLKAAAEELKTQLAQFAEVSGLEDSLAYDKEEVILELTPQGQALGFTPDGLGRVLRQRLNGIEAATYPEGPRTGTIRVELPAGELTADFLDRTRMRTTAGDYVALADLVSVDTRQSFSTIRRENGIQLVTVNGDLDEDNAARADEIMTILEGEILPSLAEEFGIAYELAGLSEQSDRFLGDAMRGLALCLLGIYLCLAWIFSSWTRPVVVMAIIPFGLVGTFYGHMQWGVPLSMFSVVGIIGMTGIIINDSIVLVTTIDEHAERKGLIPAIIDGACDRLRAVMLTTMTTVLGLLPLLYEGSVQAEFLKPTVITLVYGLGFGMFLVLLVVPSLVAMQGDVAGQVAAVRRALFGRKARGSAAVSAAAALAVLGVAAIFAATLGALVVTGALPAAVAGMAPGGSGAAALGLFLGGSAIWVLAIYVAATVWVSLRGKPGAKAEA